MDENNKLTKKQVQELKIELDKLLDKYDAEITTNITFAKYRILPDEVQLALLVIQNNGGSISSDIVKKSKSEPEKKVELLKE